MNFKSNLGPNGKNMSDWRSNRGPHANRNQLQGKLQRREKTPFPKRFNQKSQKNPLNSKIVLNNANSKRESALFKLKRKNSGVVDLKSLDLGKKRKQNLPNSRNEGHRERSRNSRFRNPLKTGSESNNQDPPGIIGITRFLPKKLWTRPSR